MTDERVKRALMRDDIIELSLGLGYVAVRDGAIWVILEDPVDVLDEASLYDGDDEGVHSALLHDARRHLKNVDRLRAVLDAQAAPRSDPPESYVGRVFKNGQYAASFLFYVAAHGGGTITCLYSDGSIAERPLAYLQGCTELPDHPMATDPPREDGLGWQEGDVYDMPGNKTLVKRRGGIVVARAPLPDLGMWELSAAGQQRLTFTPQWEPVEREMSAAERLVASWHPSFVEMHQLDLLAIARSANVSPEQLRDALEAAGWERADEPVETWRKP